MKASDELFQLIRSLTPSEKRYFKTNAKKESATSNYLQLFDAIDSQKEYDEAMLKKKHASKKFVKYLSAEKGYLHDQIMKQMRAFHAERTVDNKIHELMQDERLYRDKGLVELREKCLLKAKELATRYERFYLLKEILIKQTGFVIEFERKNVTQPVLDLINEQKKLALVQETALELQTKNRELFSMLRAGADMKDRSNISRVEILFAEVETFRPRIGNWFTLKTHFARAMSNYHHLKRDLAKSCDETLTEYECYQKHEHFKSEDSMNYKICLANLMARSLSAGRDNIFEQALSEMKALPVSTFNEEGEVFQNVYFQEHLYYLNKGRFEEAAQLVPTIEEGLVKYANKVNTARRLAFLFNIMVMFFIMHRFKDALAWNDRLLEDNGEIKQQQRMVTVLLLPIIHFELGHEDLVESFTRSAYRFLQKKNRLHEFERLVIKYLKGMPLSTDQIAFKEKLTWFHAELEKLEEDPDISAPLGMEELLLWSNFHLKGIRMDEQLADSL